jgi:hypothetical protein
MPNTDPQNSTACEDLVKALSAMLIVFEDKEAFANRATHNGIPLFDFARAAIAKAAA